jgi:GNAT superfamily N-acetyltransferase
MAYSHPELLRSTHAVDEFGSGEDSLDIWLHRNALQAQNDGSARVYVTTDGTNQVVGYYAIAAGAVRPHDATARLLKGQPAERDVPILLLARLAVDKRHQRRGIGRSLLVDALQRCARVANEAGVRALAVHALHTSAREFYTQYGFEPSPTDPLHLILLMKDLLKLLAKASEPA